MFFKAKIASPLTVIFDFRDGKQNKLPHFYRFHVWKFLMNTALPMSCKAKRLSDLI